MIRAIPPLLALCLPALTLAGCDAGPSGDDQDAPRSATAKSLAVTGVECPKVGVSKQHTVRFRPDDRSGSSPRLSAVLTVHDLGERNYCVDAYLDEETPDDVAQRITSFTVTPAQNSANYGESYSTSDRTGSDELLNFPFAFHTYGACRIVTARILVTDRDGTEHSYTAASHAGPRCGQVS